MRLVVLLVWSAASAWACSCISGSTACSAMTADSVVFVARVIRDSGRGINGAPAHVVIEEAIRNVPEGLKETDLLTGSGTDCEIHLTPGQRYLITTSGSGPTYGVGLCSPPIPIGWNNEIEDALRTQAIGGPSSFLGAVYKTKSADLSTPELSGVQVTVDGPGGHFETITDGAGRYRFNGLASGRYKVKLTKDRFTVAPEYGFEANLLDPVTNQREVLASDEVIVRENRCTLRSFGMSPAGKIEGFVRNAEGLAVAGVQVEAFGIDTKGRRNSVPAQSATTDGSGHYSLQPMPAGTFDIAVNGRRFEDNSPYPPAFHRGQIELEESGSAESVDVAVAAPRTPAELKVTVLTPDGQVLPNAVVRLEAPDGTERKRAEHQTNAMGETSVPAYVGERYLVHVTGYRRTGAEVTEYEGITEFRLTNAESALEVRVGRIGR